MLEKTKKTYAVVGKDRVFSRAEGPAGRKILVVGQVPPPVHGSNVMTERFLSALKDNGICGNLLEKNFSRKLDQVGKFSLGKLLKVPGLCQGLLCRIRYEKPDLCVYFISVSICSLLVDCLLLFLLRQKKVPYVLYFHGKGYRNFEFKTNFWVGWLIRGALGKALGGLVLGEGLKQDVSHCISPEKLYVLPNGLPDMEMFTLETETVSKGTVKIIFLSNLIPTKGPETFLLLAKDLCSQENSVRFVLAGQAASEDYLAQLHAFVRKEDLQEFVEIPGPLYDQAKTDLFEQSDVFVLPTNKDVFPLVILEAMQWGLPVVSSPLGAIPEIIRDGENGYIVEPTNKGLLAERVLELVRNKALRQRMGAAGKKIFREQYSLRAYNRNVGKALNFIDQSLCAQDKSCL